MRRTSVAAVVVFAALVFGACDRTAAPAARVNGETVSQDQLWNRVALQKKLTEVTGDTSSGALAAGKLESSYATQGVSEILGGLVVNRILEQEITRLGLVVDDATIEDVRAQVQQSAQDAQTLRQLAPEDQYLLLRQFGVAQVLQDWASDPAHLAEPDEDTVRTFFDDDPEQFRMVCARILFTTGAPQADAARARIAAGESFETVAKEMSVDPGQSKDGAVQCLAQRSLPPELADATSRAARDTLLVPVKTADGYYVVFLVETREPSLDTARGVVAEQVSSNPQVKLQLILQRALRMADVEVNPEFGMWTADLQTPVVPRTGPAITGEEGQGQSPEDRSRREELMTRLPPAFLAQLTPTQRARLDEMPIDDLAALVSQVEQAQLGSDVAPDPGAAGGDVPDTEATPAAPGG